MSICFHLWFSYFLLLTRLRYFCSTKSCSYPLSAKHSLQAVFAIHVLGELLIYWLALWCLVCYKSVIGFVMQIIPATTVLGANIEGVDLRTITRDDFAIIDRK